MFLAVLSRPTFLPDTRALDVSVSIIVLVGLIQLVPLPIGMVRFAAPGVVSIHRALTLGALPSFVPISIDPRSTVEALAVFAGAAVLYWSARRTFASGGVRQISRAVGWLGLLMACGAIVQLGVSRPHIYGFWTPRDTGAIPFGPFVNRNHAATWLVMAIPLCFGYLLARLRPGATPSGRRMTAVRQALDARTVWLTGSAMVMLVALATSLSRSGAIGFAVAAATAAMLARSRLDSVRKAWAAAAVLAAGIVVLQFADVIAVAGRFSDSSQGTAGRVHIWRDTLTMWRSVWLTGSGLGTFQDGMLLFQTGDRTYYFNHAHNHLLQAAAEGGVLLLAPVAAAVIGLVAAGRARLTETSGLVWIRAGAATGLFAAGVQSLWETGLRMPANAALAAVLAAILTHRSRAASPPFTIQSVPWP